MEIISGTDLHMEFDRQVQTLLDKEYPAATGLSSDDFQHLIAPLRQHIQHLSSPEVNIEQGQLPFVIVIRSTLISVSEAMERVERQGKPGITRLFPREPEDFRPIDTMIIPDAAVYLLVDIDRGKTNINLPPVEAMPMIANAGRSPLTIDEGIAIVTHYPDFLMKNNCFSLLASRHSSDKRVPAIWINANKQPNLGWCWDGNPHTWLGSASCANRLS